MMLTPIILKNKKHIAITNIFCSFLNLLAFIGIAIDIYMNFSLTYLYDFFYIDSFTLIQLLLVASVSFLTSVYSLKYICTDNNTISIFKAKVYYFLFSFFSLSMIFVCLSNNVICMWLGLESTTIATAFLIGFNKDKYALEAAWKYIIICSIGIGIGLIGIILFVYSAGIMNNDVLKWTYLLKISSSLNPNIAKIAFVLIFIGLGTKAGIAPMHTWLPDAHSEAPSPISAMMSGVLLNVAMFVIIKFYIITKTMDGLYNLNYLFITFGCISIIIASFSLLKQTNYKRLFAFSSVENIGIITLGIGFGGPIGVFGALLHTIIHSFGKTLMFFVCGNILHAFKSKRVDKISCLLKTMPITTFFLTCGLLILVGIPPFPSFFSELNIIISGLQGNYYVPTAILILCLLVVLSGFLNTFVKMIFKIDENIIYTKLEDDKNNILPLIFTLIFILLLSALSGNYLTIIINRATAIICG